MPEGGRIGIMQGRLVPPEPGRFQSFPVTRWRDEFGNAAAAGIETIEWIYDAYGAAENPLASDAGIAEMRSLGSRYGIAVISVCADYFMDRPIVRAGDSERADLGVRLAWLIERCRQAAIERIVVPFVDASRLQSDADEDRAVEFLRDALRGAERAGVELHLETSLGPAEFARLLGRLPHPMLFVNYDAGNSASLGYDPRAEFAAYGRRIGSVHVKDRVLGGGTVALGTGDADLEAVFEGLAAFGYGRDYVLQAARGADGAEVELATHNAAFVRSARERDATAAPR